MEFRRLYVRVDLDRIDENLKTIKAGLKDGIKMLAVVKADAYGHGATTVAKHIENKIDMFGVANIDEAAELREAGITKDILILGHTDPEEFQRVVDFDITPTIYCYDDAKKLGLTALENNKTVKIHIKVDTGMGRIGCPATYASAEEVKKISEIDGIVTEGVFTHMARADETDKTSAKRQIELFSQFIKMCADLGVFFDIKHVSNSAGIIETELDCGFDMVRCGIIMYGVSPSDEVRKDYPLLPAMQLIARVSHLKTLSAGNGISYGHTYVTSKETKIATFPCGYADGYPRCLSNKGYVVISGNKCPIIGRVCMDQFMVDVTEVSDIKIGDEAVLMGEGITIDSLAQMAGTISYELCCTVGRRVPRAYFLNGKHVETISYVEN